LDIKEYISSGVIETYLLGIASPHEVAELESLRKQHLEIELAIQEVQDTIEGFAMSHLETPPAKVKDKLWSELGLLESSKEEEEEVPVVKVVELPAVPTSPIYKYLAAASVIVLLGSLIYNFVLISKVDSLRANIDSLNTKDRLINQELSDTKQQLAILNNPNSKHIRLDGTENFKGNLASVVWNNESKEVYLQLHQMQTLPSDKQYQLWAIVGGQPVDLGVYQTGAAMQKMKNIEGAQMFAITIEKAGGSATPTLEQMIVAGPV